MKNRFVRPLFHTEDGEPPTPPVIVPPAPAVPPTSTPPAAVLPDGRSATEVMEENRRKAVEIETLKREKAERLAADQAAEEAAAIKRGEHQGVIDAQAVELAELRAHRATQETAETEEKTAAGVAFEAAIKDRSDADLIRQRCLTWGGTDPRKQLRYYRDEILATMPAPTPVVTTTPNPGGNPELPLPELTVSEKKLCDDNGIEHKFYAMGKAKSADNPSLRRTIEDLGGR